MTTPPPPLMPREQRLKLLFAPIVIRYITPMPWRGVPVNSEMDLRQYADERYRESFNRQVGYSDIEE